MVQRDDERLIWKYLDGQASDLEISDLFCRFEKNATLRGYFDLVSQIDQNLVQSEPYKLSENLKQKIIKSTSAHVVAKKSLTESMPLGGLKPFVILHLILLSTGIMIFLSNLDEFEFTNLHVLQSVIQITESPIVRLLLLLSIGFFVLFIFDSYLKVRNQGKLTTPV